MRFKLGHMTFPSTCLQVPNIYRLIPSGGPQNGRKQPSPQQGPFRPQNEARGPEHRFFYLAFRPRPWTISIMRPLILDAGVMACVRKLIQKLRRFRCCCCLLACLLYSMYLLLVYDIWYKYTIPPPLKRALRGGD